jgi:hypothetical protein
MLNSDDEDVVGEKGVPEINFEDMDEIGSNNHLSGQIQ